MANNAFQTAPGDYMSTINAVSHKSPVAIGMGVYFSLNLNSLKAANRAAKKRTYVKIRQSSYLKKGIVAERHLKTKFGLDELHVSIVRSAGSVY